MSIDAQKKTVYHSALVSASPVEALITSDVMESKFKKGTFYVVAKINGNEHQLSIENDRCKAALSGHKNKFVVLTAAGSREEADIQVQVMAMPATSLPPKHLSPAPPPEQPRPMPQRPQPTQQAQQESHGVTANVTQIEFRQQMTPRQYESISIQLTATVPAGEKLWPHYKDLRDKAEQMLLDAVAHRNREGQ